MPLYRKKGTEIVVEAVQLTADNVDKVANWAQAQVVEEIDAIDHDCRSEALNVWARNGEHRYARCSRGMYVVKYAETFYVAGQNAFESTYEAVI